MAAFAASTGNMATDVAGWELSSSSRYGGSKAPMALFENPTSTLLLGHAPAEGDSRQFSAHYGELTINTLGELDFGATCDDGAFACSTPILESTTVSLFDEPQKSALPTTVLEQSAFQEKTAPKPNPMTAWVFGFVILAAGFMSSRYRWRIG